MIILKVTKNCGFTLSLEDTIFEKPQGGGGQFDPLPAVLGLRKNAKKETKLFFIWLLQNVFFKYYLVNF